MSARRKTTLPSSTRWRNSATSGSTMPSRLRIARTPRPRGSATGFPPLQGAPCRPSSRLLRTPWSIRGVRSRQLWATAKQILAEARSQQREIVLPLDAVVAKKFESRAPARAVDVGAVDNDDIILDIGPRTIEHIIAALERSHTLVWNGPLGAFETEPFDSGTREVAKAAANLGEAGKLVTVAGGGDTVAALNAAGVADRFTYVSTAGGAFLEWLEGKVLPGVEVLRIK